MSAHCCAGPACRTSAISHWCSRRRRDASSERLEICARFKATERAGVTRAPAWLGFALNAAGADDVRWRNRRRNQADIAKTITGATNAELSSHRTESAERKKRSGSSNSTNAGIARATTPRRAGVVLPATGASSPFTTGSRYPAIDTLSFILGCGRGVAHCFRRWISAVVRTGNHAADITIVTLNATLGSAWCCVRRRSGPVINGAATVQAESERRYSRRRGYEAVAAAIAENARLYERERVEPDVPEICHLPDIHTWTAIAPGGDLTTIGRGRRVRRDRLRRSPAVCQTCQQVSIYRTRLAETTSVRMAVLPEFGGVAHRPHVANDVGAKLAADSLFMPPGDIASSMAS